MTPGTYPPITVLNPQLACFEVLVARLERHFSLLNAAQ